MATGDFEEGFFLEITVLSEFGWMICLHKISEIIFIETCFCMKARNFHSKQIWGESRICVGNFRGRVVAGNRCHFTVHILQSV